MSQLHARTNSLALVMILLGLSACAEQAPEANLTPPAPAITAEPDVGAADDALPPDAATLPPSEEGDVQTQAGDDPHVAALLHCESLPAEEIAACRAEVDAAREHDHMQQEEATEPPK